MHVRAARKPQNPEERSTGRPLGKTLSARHRSPSPIPWREQLYQLRRATQNSASYFSGTPLCDSCVAATLPSSSDNFHLCDYPYIATDVPTPSDAMSSSDDFPDIHDSISTKFMYLHVEFKTVHVTALLDSDSCIPSLYNMLPVSVKQPLQLCNISVLVDDNQKVKVLGVTKVKSQTPHGTH